MARYIDADSVVEMLNFMSHGNQVILTPDSVKEMIDGEPTADVQPVVYAHWEQETKFNPPRCSSCKKEAVSLSECRGYFTPDVCPYCGAFMMGGE